MSRALPPGIAWKLIFSTVSPGSLVRRWPVRISRARITDSASSRGQHWSAAKLILELEPFNADHRLNDLTAYNWITHNLQNCIQKTGRSNATQREHLQRYQRSTAVLHILFKRLLSTPIALGKYMLFAADIKNPQDNIIIYIFWQAYWATPSQVSACLWHFNLTTS